MLGIDAAPESLESLNPWNLRSLANWQAPTVLPEALSRNSPLNYKIAAPQDAVDRRLQAQGRRARDRPAPSQVIAGEAGRDPMYSAVFVEYLLVMHVVECRFLRRNLLFPFSRSPASQPKHDSECLPVTPQIACPNPFFCAFHAPRACRVNKTRLTRLHAARRPPPKRDLPPLPMQFRRSSKRARTKESPGSAPSTTRATRTRTWMRAPPRSCGFP